MTEDKGLQRRTLLVGLTAAGLAAGGVGALVMKHGATGTLTSHARDALRDRVKGMVFWRGEDAYEVSRAAAAYRANKPRRYPDVIVFPESEQDVIQAVRFANEHDLKVTTRSGGHSWSSAHIRDNVLMIDMSRMQTVEIDEKSQTLWTNPGVLGSRINALLEGHDLIIPTAHHPSPGIGGFCMNGGFGWNSRLWGNGARHILALDVVTAEGELIRADAKQNSDYWWAARGGGAGFFGVVTRMQLQAHPKPKVWKISSYGFDDAAGIYDVLMTWACNIVPTLPPFLELMVSTTAHDRRTGDAMATRLTMAGLVITDDEAAADAALDILRTCPVIDQANVKIEKAPTTLEDCYQSGNRADPAGYRCAADNVYSDKPADILVPRMRKLFLDLPTPHSHSLWLAWGATNPYPTDMALSMQGPIYVASYTLWDDPSQDEKMESWASDRMKELGDLSLGGQMNDENMLRHPQRYFSPQAYAKLERLRGRHDPTRRFMSFLGNPFPA